ncbi:MAG TPA: YdcF family protein [Mucilaginibacter sp.]|nr:YdcF family protein [Mucilaginibacter sp.]
MLLVALLTGRPRLKRRLTRVALIVLVLFSNTWLLNLYAGLWNVPPAALDKNKVYSADIVLGGFTNEDKNGQGVLNGHADRFVQGLKLKRSGQVSHIFISGGNARPRGDHFTESTWAKEQLEKMGIPDTAIVIEDQSRNTVENAAFTKQVLEKSHLQPPYVLVTSAFHMRRARYIFKNAGIDVLPYPCDYIAGKTHISVTDYFVPNIATMDTWTYYLKELFGMVAAYFR